MTDLTSNSVIQDAKDAKDTRESLLEKVYGKRKSRKGRPTIFTTPCNHTLTIRVTEEVFKKVNTLADKLTEGNVTDLVRLMIDKMWEKIGDY